MRAAQRGDAAAYRQLLVALQPWLERYFRRRSPPALVDDLVQETMVAIHRKRHTYLPEQPLLPWVAAIARFKWIDALRRMARKAEVELPETAQAPERADSSAHAHSLERLLEGLPPGQALAIRLTRIVGMSVEEAASQTGQSPSLVKVNVHRGLKRLQALVAEMDMHLDDANDRPAERAN